MTTRRKDRTVAHKSSKNPTVKLMHSSYQPSKAELEADMSIDASPEDVARAVMRRVDVQYVSPSKKRKAE